MLREVTFPSDGSLCVGWHLTGVGEAFRGDAGRPCVVMAHGFGGTRDTGLLAYATGLAEAGLDVLVFDYRGFGCSEGTPRQRVAFRHQRADFHAAIAAARALEGVDPDRVVLWGTSYAGGHIVPVAVADGRIAALVSLTPLMDGITALLAIARRTPLTLVPLVLHGLRDAMRALTRRHPHYVPIVGAPGSTAIITTPGALEAYTALAGPEWRNRVCARAALEVAFNRPLRQASQVRCPILVQVGTDDAVAPPASARLAALHAGRYATLRCYPVDHFDVYEGPWQARALADQVAFLTRQLADAHSSASEDARS